MNCFKLTSTLEKEYLKKNKLEFEHVYNLHSIKVDKVENVFTSHCLATTPNQ